MISVAKLAGLTWLQPMLFGHQTKSLEIARHGLYSFEITGTLALKALPTIRESRD